MRYFFSVVIRGHVTDSPRLWLAVLQCSILPWVKTDYYIADYGRSELYRHFRYCLANFIRNFANDFQAV